MEFKSKAMAAVADMAAMHASANAVHARIAADSAEAYARRLEIADKAKAYGLSHDEVLRALDAAGRAKFEDMLSREHPGEAIVPTPFNPSPDALALLAELIAEMRALRQDHARMAQLLARWDGDGMPTTRHHGEMIIPKPPRWDGSGHGERA